MTTELAIQTEQTQRGPRVHGVVRAVVTNNQDDPAKLGRVKVRFVSFAQASESAWARLATPMAGAGYGFCALPEVDDEVLVVFEHGAIDRPIVIGALWNGARKPPYVNPDGKNALRQLRSRSGHEILLDDTDGAERVVIQDKTGKNQIVFDASKNTITIKAEKDVTIQAGGDLTLGADGTVAVRCRAFQVTANESAAVEAAQSLDLKCSPGIALNVDGLVVR
jgi:uncharacterized protein involved in type VI secretion and phage assembly